MIDVIHLYAETPDDLKPMVQTRLNIGWDLQGGLIVGHEYGLAQCMVRVQSYHEYDLIRAVSFGELDRTLNELRLDGFDLWQSVTVWNKNLLQWVFRARERDLSYIAKEVISINVPSPLALAERSGPTIRLIPNILAGAPPLVVEGGRVVDLPSQLHRSTE